MDKKEIDIGKTVIDGVVRTGLLEETTIVISVLYHQKNLLVHIGI